MKTAIFIDLVNRKNWLPAWPYGCTDPRLGIGLCSRAFRQIDCSNNFPSLNNGNEICFCTSATHLPAKAISGNRQSAAIAGAAGYFCLG